MGIGTENICACSLEPALLHVVVPLLSRWGTVVQRDQQTRCGAAVMSNEFDMESEWVTELGKARSDEYTEKILAFVQELEKTAPEPFLPLLTDLAMARALIVHLVIRYVEIGEIACALQCGEGV